jgi:hypothetical protein
VVIKIRLDGDLKGNNVYNYVQDGGGVRGLVASIM